jgi:hypothetical protein
MHELNESAYFVLICLRKKMTQDEMAHALTRRYGIDMATSQKDLSDILTLFRRRKIIEQ